jgi:hypothetical protein
MHYKANFFDFRKVSELVQGGTVRMILTVPDTDAFFDQVLIAGASQVFPGGEEYE